MAYGAEIFDSSGTKVLSITDRTSRFVADGTFTITTGNSSKTVSITGMTNTDKFQVFVAPTNHQQFVTTTKGTDQFTTSLPVGFTAASNLNFTFMVIAT